MKNTVYGANTYRCTCTEQVQFAICTCSVHIVDVHFYGQPFQNDQSVVLARLKGSDKMSKTHSLVSMAISTGATLSLIYPFTKWRCAGYLRRLLIGELISSKRSNWDEILGVAKITKIMGFKTWAKEWFNCCWRCCLGSPSSACRPRLNPAQAGTLRRFSIS